ncbi:rod shape-determining protein MreC [Sulfurimonas sp.]|uniref:rod shape-determining protein MreC n=1 Tax=Sulfurimonas sp. TaxID=2022749 RepID=UPI0025EC464E|nr:rod shape-determining protein MreC [Sulfurimonas sp.]MDD5156647.1 rod shape-determining protein MreC [Sulfurimonas sp.]
MTKKLIGSLSLFIALLVGALYFTGVIQSPIISLLNSIKIDYHNSVEFIDSKIDSHFFQAQQILQLKKQLSKYEENHLLMQQLASEVNGLLSQNSSRLKSEPEVQLVRAISYQRFGDFNRVWLEIKDYNSSKIYGLINKEVVAGIVVSDGGRALGILNSDIKSSYSVYVGDESAPGIAHGNNSKNLVVTFIPAWYPVKKGDLVTTSGLDGIFFSGLKVGTILSITKAQGFQTAEVVPYYKSNNPNYFHIIKKVR